MNGGLPSWHRHSISAMERTQVWSLSGSAANSARSNDLPADIVVRVTRDTTVPEPIGQHVVSRVVAISPVHDTLTLETSSHTGDGDRAGQDESQPREDAHRPTMPSLRSATPSPVSPGGGTRVTQTKKMPLTPPWR